MYLEPLLKFIRRVEAKGDYNIVWGGIARHDHPPRPLTMMTVEEVLAWQDSIDAKYMSEAAGAYQIMEDTLRGLYRSAGVPLTAVFDKETQDKLAIALLRRRGLDDYLAGRMTAHSFADSLAKEWAALPVTTGAKRGKSYYGGDGLNHTNVPVGDFLSAVRSIHGDPEPEPRGSKIESTTLQATGGGAVAVATGGAAAVANLDGTAQIVVIVALAVAALAFAWIARERISKWAKGIR